jgi:hypothetical protein
MAKKKLEQEEEKENYLNDEVLLEKKKLVGEYMGATVTQEYPYSPEYFGKTYMFDYGQSSSKENRARYPENSRFYSDSGVKYNSEPNWLMPAVWKALNEIRAAGYKAYTEEEYYYDNLADTLVAGDIEVLFNALVEYLKYRQETINSVKNA